MNRVETPQGRCRLAFARVDITPPVGMYHRMWGAARHDRSTGVHRPLTATALWLEPADGTDRRLVIGLDHCLLERAEIDRIRARVAAATPLEPEQVHVTLSHTHGSGFLSRSRADLPGGDLIGPYLDWMAEACEELAARAASSICPATIVYGTARCSLAAHRDFHDGATGRTVCGFDPAGPADDTVLVARAIAADGATLGTVVNYACHPTTLAWDNTLISPDYVGALREVVEGQTGAPCLFVQGASGDLGPREGFVGDPAVADRNGRQLGYAALAGLEALPRPGTHFEYAGPVESGATIGTWEHRPLDREAMARQARWGVRRFTVELPYRQDLPTLDETREHLARWQAQETAARAAGDDGKARDCRAHTERMTRQMARLESLPEGLTFPYLVTLFRLGDALWVLVPGELYQVFQTALRARFPGIPVVVATVTDGWLPGYIPPATLYGQGVYQETIATVGPGSLETLIDTIGTELARM